MFIINKSKKETNTKAKDETTMNQQKMLKIIRVFKAIKRWYRSRINKHNCKRTGRRTDIGDKPKYRVHPKDFRN